jgi:hypothetical protein
MLHSLILATVTFSVAGSLLPKQHLIMPVVVCDQIVLDDSRAKLRLRQVIKCVFLEEVVPHNVDGGHFLIVEIVVPFLQYIYELVTLLPPLIFGDIVEFYFSVYFHHQLLLLPHQGSGSHTSYKLQKRLFCKFVLFPISKCDSQLLIQRC